ncbi:MAG: hypothetical protein HY879_13825 [Deltaproteobacteria bacterium]|nr:hypothetical protein [Deltaproteobacteria bacterium]
MARKTAGSGKVGKPAMVIPSDGIEGLFSTGGGFTGSGAVQRGATGQQ